MIEGLALGFLSWLGLMMTWHNLPLWVKRWTVVHSLISELVAGISTWFFLTAISKSLVAVIGSTVAGLLVNFTIIFLANTGWLDE